MLGESSTLRDSRRSACRCRLCAELAIVTSNHGLDLGKHSNRGLSSIGARRTKMDENHNALSPTHHVRSTVEIAITFVPLATLWVLAWTALHFGYWWLSLPLAIPAAGFLVRLFMIQHDCGHGSFFRHRMANDWVGRVIGVLTLTPYDFWRRTHAIHHASSGHLERRGIGDVDTLTVNEYLLLSSGVVFAIGRTGIRSSCSVSVQPICSFCNIGCRLVCSSAAGSLGSALWRPMLQLPPLRLV